MLPQVVTVGPLVVSSTNNIVTSITPTSGTLLTINGALANAAGVAIMDTPRRVLLTYGSEGSARTLVVTGTNHTGNPIQETLAIPSGGSGTVYTVQDFATVISLLPQGGGWTAAVTIGTNGIASSPWKFTSFEFGPMNMAVGVVVSGTVNYTVEVTYSNPNNNQNILGGALGNYPTTVNVFPVNGLTSQVGNLDATITGPNQAWRLTLNSQTNPGFVTATGIQSGIVNAGV